MSNPSADYPDNLHDPVDISELSDRPLGATTPNHTYVHGKLEQEVHEIQRKLGVGDAPASGATSGHVLTKRPDGTTRWQEVVGTPGPKGDKGDPGPQGPKGDKGDKGDPGEGGGAEDVEWQQIDDVVLFDVFSGSPVDFGTGGFSFIRWYRNGRQVIGKYYAGFDTDSSGYGAPGASLFIILPTELPALPLPAPLLMAVPSSFGYLSLTPSETEPGEIGLTAPAIVDMGNTQDPTQLSMAFVCPPAVTPFGYEGLWGNGTPLTLDGRVARLQASFDYEAAYAEGDDDV